MLKKQFVTYEIACRLRTKGFDEECLMCFYGENNFGQPKNKLYMPAGFGKVINSVKGCKEDEDWLTAPLWQQAVDWLREERKLSVEVQSELFAYSVYIIYDTLGQNTCKFIQKDFMDHRQALIFGIEHALTLIND